MKNCISSGFNNEASGDCIVIGNVKGAVVNESYSILLKGWSSPKQRVYYDHITGQELSVSGSREIERGIRIIEPLLDCYFIHETSSGIRWIEEIKEDEKGKSKVTGRIL